MTNTSTYAAARDSEPSWRIGKGGADPRPAAVTFATTEHFVLQGARSATIAESTGRVRLR